MILAMGQINSEASNLDGYDFNEDEFVSDELRSENDTSYAKLGYVVVSPAKKKKKTHRLYIANKDRPVKFEVRMKYANTVDQRSVVREYGIKEKRSVISLLMILTWCKFDVRQAADSIFGAVKGGEAVQIKTLLNDHLCTKR